MSAAQRLIERAPMWVQVVYLVVCAVAFLCALVLLVAAHATKSETRHRRGQSE